MVIAPTKSVDHGQRSIPAQVETITHDQLTDLRALQRTFDGAYTRTALGQLSYAIVILRLFDRSFYWCGLVYTVLAAQLILIAIYRYNLAMSNHDRWSDVNLGALTPNGDTIHASNPSGQSVFTPSGEPPQVLFRRTFHTAGTVVAIATCSTFVLLVALTILILKM